MVSLDIGDDNSITDDIIHNPADDIQIESPSYLTRCEVDGEHRVPVCVVCDIIIKGVEPICQMKKDRLLNNKERLSVSVKGYEAAHGKLNVLLVKQYEIEGYEGMLLSKRSCCDKNGVYQACASCFRATAPSMAKKTDNSLQSFLLQMGLLLGRFHSSYHLHFMTVDS